MAQRTFQPLIDRLEEDRPDAPFAPDEVRDLLAVCALGADVLDRFGEMIQERLRWGVEKQQLQILLKELAQALERAQSMVYPRVRSITAIAAIPADEQSTSLESLDEWTARAAAQFDRVTSLQRWLDRPRPPFDEALLARDSDSPNESRYVDIEEVLARIKAGGDA